jgi:hypothetical protein
LWTRQSWALRGAPPVRFAVLVWKTCAHGESIHDHLLGFVILCASGALGVHSHAPEKESSLGLMEVTTWAKRRQSDGRAVTQVKRLSLVRCYPRADRVENLEGNSRPPLLYAREGLR